MPTLVHHLLTANAGSNVDNLAIIHKDRSWTFSQLADLVSDQAKAFAAIKLPKQQRVAVFLPKQIETITSFLATSLAGGVFVPVNPVLKAAQVGHILSDCHVQILITSKTRLQGIKETLEHCADLHTIILADTGPDHSQSISNKCILAWQEFLDHGSPRQTLPLVIDADMAAILYTSGSTGKPKGVVLSHQNIVTGAKSVAEYLEISWDDRLLAVLPFSFDYGLNQLMSALLKQACCVLMDYLLPSDVINAVANERITGLAAVPPLWVQLAQLEWPSEINGHLRYMTNSGGKMPRPALDSLRASIPGAKFFLMYGLTEAFRSTYLPPDQLDKRPDSMGKAIPNAEVLVARADGSPCAPHEPGELVHRGSLVALGYWNDPAKTAERFRPSPIQQQGLPLPEIAVWSGDTVTMDEDGYFYFVGRNDGMIKTSGYRVSPTEVEEVIYASGLVEKVAVIGIPDSTLGQAIVAVATPNANQPISKLQLLAGCKRQLPNFMVPTEIKILESLPKNPNGKIDRTKLVEHFISRSE